MNTQPIEKLLPDGAPLQVHSIFRTIQGEGPHSGRPAIFVRLFGCSLACPSCDSDYTSRRDLMSEDCLLSYLQGMSKVELIVISGGEPLRQRSLGRYIERLVHHWEIQIETNGAHSDPNLPKGAYLVCSPKVPKINTELVEAMWKNPLNSFKYVMDCYHVSEEDGLPTSVLGLPHAPGRPPAGFPRSRIYLQPADEKNEAKNKKNLDAVVQSCLKYGYRLSLQIHKIAGLP